MQVAGAQESSCMWLRHQVEFHLQDNFVYSGLCICLRCFHGAVTPLVKLNSVSVSLSAVLEASKCSVHQMS